MNTDATTHAFTFEVVNDITNIDAMTKLIVIGIEVYNLNTRC
jgi:hypothetical protein